VESHGRSLVCALLDLMLEFVRYHLLGRQLISSRIRYFCTLLQNLAEGFSDICT
jgi:hypothetical protein